MRDHDLLLGANHVAQIDDGVTMQFPDDVLHHQREATLNSLWIGLSDLPSGIDAHQSQVFTSTAGDTHNYTG